MLNRPEHQNGMVKWWVPIAQKTRGLTSPKIRCYLIISKARQPMFSGNLGLKNISESATILLFRIAQFRAAKQVSRAQPRKQSQCIPKTCLTTKIEVRMGTRRKYLEMYIHTACQRVLAEWRECRKHQKSRPDACTWTFDVISCLSGLLTRLTINWAFGRLTHRCSAKTLESLAQPRCVPWFSWT